MNWYKEAQVTISLEELEYLEKIVQKLIKGCRNYTKEELQLQANFPELLEILLREAQRTQEE